MTFSISRRNILRASANGFGAVAAEWLLQRQAFAAKPPHFAPKAKSVIFLFMVGAPSSMDTFDPKPSLKKYEGQPLPASFGKVGGQFTDGSNPLLASPWEFQRYGQSGIPVSSLYPHLAQCVDDICFVRSFYTESVVHAPAMYQVHTGRILMGWPSMGSWVTYGLGSETDNLPAYVVMPQPEGTPEGGTPCWGSGFLPAVHQGTLLRSGASPILNLKPPAGVTPEKQRRTLDLLQQMNAMDATPQDQEMAARIASYELAFKMQTSAPEAVDISKEPEHIRKMYGIDQKRTVDFGMRCLLARRMVERGVRFVQLYSGGGPVSMQWDAHSHLKANHEKMCGLTDQPVAALLQDLKQRGLLDTTLVIWGSEFGRLPTSESGNGRDHNPHGYTMWFAGGGVKGGRIIGETDEFGLRGVGQRYHMRDFHATILELLGMDQNRLWYLHNGRHEKLTDFGGTAIKEVFT
ncbi:DUF1501 domain-containing protein [Bryobacter aggregatus]|uniref:DUF1501 domain-containing protein n=1 Tax=Bryobacter aggregatus TaxID=360054 RepID=UPI0004E14F83|nr:DUF1501 domain-containing protein [Bryobacter aggregatus]